MISEFESKLVYKSSGIYSPGTYERQTTFKYNDESFSIECNFERMLEFIKILQNEKPNSYQRIKYTKATK